MVGAAGVVRSRRPPGFRRVRPRRRRHGAGPRRSNRLDHTAYRYRDYVIRAWNEDVPYDRFVVEHLAGDLLDDPRRHPTLGTDETILGTMAFFFAEGTHSPVDVREEMRTRVDNQIDVLGKAFLGLTVARARCHDHKFDAITARDDYALVGHLQSVRHQYAPIDPPDRVAELETIRAALAAEVAGLGHALVNAKEFRDLD